MANPVFKITEQEYPHDMVIEADKIMTVNGTVQKAGVLGIILLISAAFVWTRYTLGYMDIATLLTGVGLILGFILALIISFTKNKYLVPLYAACEGFLLGGISATVESSYPGIISQAVAGTFAALFSMLILYRLGVIRNTDKLRGVVLVSTASICGIYLINFIGGFFGYSIPVINTSAPLGILFSIVIIAVAALNLIIDFDFIEKCAERMMPKDYEWYGAFGLMVTMVWLYIEILNLLAKLNRR